MAWDRMEVAVVKQTSNVIDREFTGNLISRFHSMRYVQYKNKLIVLITEKTKFSHVITFLNMKITPKFSNASFVNVLEPEMY